MWWLDKRKPVDPQMAKRIDELELLAHRLEIKILQLQELHEQLQGAHDKLRSKFYGTLGAAVSQDSPPGRYTKTASPGTAADMLLARAHAARNQ